MPIPCLLSTIEKTSESTSLRPRIAEQRSRKWAVLVRVTINHRRGKNSPVTMELQRLVSRSLRQAEDAP